MFPLVFIPLGVVLAADIGPPPILFVHREFLKPGVDDAYRKIEEDAARICAEMKCPNTYIGLESLTGPKEAWWINGFASEQAMNRVGDQYAKDKPLSEALDRIAKQKADLIDHSWEAPMKYRADLSQGGWQVGQGRFLAILIGKGSTRGAVYEAADGTRLTVIAARTRAKAEKAAGREARIFAIRPKWSMPAKEWVSSDPEFWK